MTLRSILDPGVDIDKQTEHGMGILDELTSATGDKQSNKELVKRCLVTPPLLHSIAEGLRTGGPPAKVDCAQILTDVGQRRPDLIGEFVADFLDATRSKSPKVAKLAFTGLEQVVGANPAEVYGERDYLFQVAREGGKLALSAAGVLGTLCGNNPNYRGKLLGNLVRLLNNIPDPELAKWVKAIAPAVEGSADGLKRLTDAVQPRRAALPEAEQKKLDKLLLKLERSTAKKK